MRKLEELKVKLMSEAAAEAFRREKEARTNCCSGRASGADSGGSSSSRRCNRKVVWWRGREESRRMRMAEQRWGAKVVPMQRGRQGRGGAGQPQHAIGFKGG